MDPMRKSKIRNRLLDLASLARYAIIPRLANAAAIISLLLARDFPEGRSHDER